MSDVSLFLELFHFIRPWLLVLLPLVALLWWRVRRRLGKSRLPEAHISPHLARALTVGQDGASRLLPIDGVALGLILICLGAAGPTWSRVPDPFVAQTAPLVIALKVTPSMQNRDLAPTRLERAKQKVRDLLALRSGARSALVAYAGTAHAVVPMTEDPNVLQPYLEGLQVDVMPDEGNATAAALELARAIMEKETAAGGILFVTDDISGADVAALNGYQGASLAVLATLPQGTGSAGLDALTIPVEQVSVDDSDIIRLDRRLNAAYRRALAEDGDQPWDDRGWLLAWPAALLALIWFRRGWTMRWGAVALAGLLLPAQPSRAEGIADWFLTPDQQGQIAYGRRHFDRAGELYLEPMHKAYALYRDGQYPAVTEALAGLDSADAAFLSGMAHIKNRDYRDAIEDFQTALERDPDFPGAAGNLEVARKIVDYVEEAREQSDTGENTGEGADDVVFDNEDARGADTQIQGGDDAAELLTADQWMNTVDTNTGDFLRQRFAIEAARR
ncbi:VWA domain-containing protein [Paracoccus ravus]|uniref:VWA domain-containing protein n=1 Tax=Paracoccus ravus TaxID=2447760 RepID=UPI00106EFBFD|nr:VWA domain-containing protein [Paracoccus ravus]